MIHLVNKSPFENCALDECVRFAMKGSTIILYEDAVFAVKSGASYETTALGIVENHKVYVLAPDLEARAIESLTPGVQKIDYGQFVELVERDKTLSWL